MRGVNVILTKRAGYRPGQPIRPYLQVFPLPPQAGYQRYEEEAGGSGRRIDKEPATPSMTCISLKHIN
jgi:hypothetical protein